MLEQEPQAPPAALPQPSHPPHLRPQDWHSEAMALYQSGLTLEETGARITPPKTRQRVRQVLSVLAPEILRDRKTAAQTRTGPRAAKPMPVCAICPATLTSRSRKFCSDRCKWKALDAAAPAWMAKAVRLVQKGHDLYAAARLSGAPKPLDQKEIATQVRSYMEVRGIEIPPRKCRCGVCKVVFFAARKVGRPPALCPACNLRFGTGVRERALRKVRKEVAA